MKKYYIFNKKDPTTPLSRVDNNYNSRVVEYSEEQARRYIAEKNKIYGKEQFYYMEREEWLRYRMSPECDEINDKIDKIVYEIVNTPQMKMIQQEISKMNDKNLRGFSKLYEAINNEDYEKKLKEELDSFVKKIDIPAFRKEGILVDDVKDVCKKTIEAFEMAKTGKSQEAERIVEDILKSYEKYPFAVSELDKSYAFRGAASVKELRQEWVSEAEYDNMMDGELSFFRARVIENGKKIKKREEMNYLPYSMRNLTKDMRFSSKGKVCLYLGTTSYVCSKECRWNEKDNLYLASFRFNEKGKKMKILNFIISQSLLNGMISSQNACFNNRELYNAILTVFPLAIATMFTIGTDDEERRKQGETFKAEYLLSQVLINALQKTKIDGVAYLSRQSKDDFEYPQMVCLAIPIPDANEKNEYGELINDFVMTEPVLFNESIKDGRNGRKSYINEKFPPYLKKEWGKKDNFIAKIDNDGERKFYQETAFSRMDDYLVNQPHKNQFEEE